MAEVKNHCVIELTCKAGIGRTWVTSEAEAVAHATRLLDEKHRKSGYKNTKPVRRLAVVKVLKIVELAEPIAPPVNVRLMKGGDEVVS